MILQNDQMIRKNKKIAISTSFLDDSFVDYRRFLMKFIIFGLSVFRKNHPFLKSNVISCKVIK